jgi:hypothetical protein
MKNGSTAETPHQVGRTAPEGPVGLTESVPLLNRFQRSADPLPALI